MFYEQCVSSLGLKAKDKVTGATGMISSLCFDVYECIQVILTPDKLDKDGKEVHFGWIDINRLKILSKVPVLTHPEFSIKYPSFKDKHKTYKKVHGPANKPLR